jgi:hypothetical protein
MNCSDSRRPRWCATCSLMNRASYATRDRAASRNAAPGRVRQLISREKAFGSPPQPARRVTRHFLEPHRLPERFSDRCVSRGKCAGAHRVRRNRPSRQGSAAPARGIQCRTVPASAGRAVNHEARRRAFLACGILPSLLYAAMIWAIRYEGYSLVSQVPSELTAIGAPTQRLWTLLGPIYTLLVTAFGWGVWQSAGRHLRVRVVGGLMPAFGSLGLLWPFARMHQREVLAARAPLDAGAVVSRQLLSSRRHARVSRGEEKADHQGSRGRLIVARRRSRRIHA